MPCRAAASYLMPARHPKGVLSDLVRTKTAVKEKSNLHKPPSIGNLARNA